MHWDISGLFIMMVCEGVMRSVDMGRRMTFTRGTLNQSKPFCIVPGGGGAGV